MVSYNAAPMDKLAVIAVSTREGRQGFPIVEWFVERAKAHGKFEVQLIDLKQVNLPLFDEPHHPRLRNYQHEHTKRWSAVIDPIDAFVFVTSEYNYSMPPSFVNAVDYLYQEWAYKPAGFVSYGGPAGGARAVTMEKSMLTSVKVMPMLEGVMVPFFTKHIENGRFVAGDMQDKGAVAMLDELLKWSGALKPLRTKAA
jgi:NAD(P)H-dependent FMN reductase